MKKPPQNEAADIKMSINYLQTTACDILRSSWDKEDPLKSTCPLFTEWT